MQYSKTPLHCACRNGYVDTAYLLISVLNDAAARGEGCHDNTRDADMVWERGSCSC